MSEAENAIRCFETVTKLPVVVHDLRNGLWNDIPWERARHSQPLCQKVKASSVGMKCQQFELKELRATVHQWSEGRVHRCHAGLVELVQPIFDAEGLLFVLFAGPCQWKDDRSLDVIA